MLGALSQFVLAALLQACPRGEPCMSLHGASLRGRHSPRATLAQEGKIYVMCSGQRGGPHDLLIIGANWRLENAKSPAAMLQENNPQTPHAGV